MTEIREYNGAQLSKELRFKLFYCGSAVLDSSWGGKVICSPISRLYFVKTGRFFLKINGERMELVGGLGILFHRATAMNTAAKTKQSSCFFISR